MTPAGKRLLDAARSTDNPYIGLHLPEQFVVDAILAIEAEAVAAERARALPVIEAAREVLGGDLFDPENAPAAHGEWRPAHRPMRERHMVLDDHDGCSLFPDPRDVSALVNGALALRAALAAWEEGK